MASPQKENGYTAIANDIIEALARTRINGETRQVIDVVFRKTYGYNKKQDPISLSQFCHYTRMRRSDVCRALNKAISMKIISKKATGGTTIYSIHKDFEEWTTVAKKPRGLLNSKSPSRKIANKRTQNSDRQKTVSKDKNKDIPASQVGEPFNLLKAVEKLEESPRREFGIIGFYFRKRKPTFENVDQYKVAVRRHLRAAIQLKPFSDKQISDASQKARDDYPEWTLDTLIKLVTK